MFNLGRTKELSCFWKKIVIDSLGLTCIYLVITLTIFCNFNFKTVFSFIAKGEVPIAVMHGCRYLIIKFALQYHS